ncbi:MAG: PD-(D/E)XK nuclease family protein, partial [Gammaproteobacteria bacterium]
APPALLRRADPGGLPVPRATPPEPVADAAFAVEYDWAGVSARHVGTVIHELLQVMHAGAVDDAWLAAARRYALNRLRALGVSGAPLESGLELLDNALANVRASERGRWLFSPAHGHARAELRLTSFVHGGERLVIDRTFVDGEGRRWIVDFKTGSHRGGGLDAYLDREVERYRPQLERYARAMAAAESRPIMLGLYFPVHDAWREWAWTDAGAPA